MDEARCYFTEAKAILAGTSIMQFEKAHGEALVEYYECRLIKLCNMLEIAKQEVLNG